MPRPITKPKTKETIRDYRLQRLYGITAAQYDQMRATQDGRCAICRKSSEKSLAVDHDHATGKVRALLCFHCNLGLGAFKDDRYSLEQAIVYLSQHA